MCDCLKVRSYTILGQTKLKNVAGSLGQRYSTIIEGTKFNISYTSTIKQKPSHQQEHSSVHLHFTFPSLQLAG